MVSDIQISSIAKVHSTISHMSEKITFILEEKSTIQSKSWHDNLNSVTFEFLQIHTTIITSVWLS